MDIPECIQTTLNKDGMHECVLLSHYSGDDVPRNCYVRGIGETQEIARLHAEMLRAQNRYRITYEEFLRNESKGTP